MAVGIKILILAVAPALASERIAGFGHSGKSLALSGAVFAFGSRKISLIPTAIVDKYAGLQTSCKLIERGILYPRRNIPE